MIDFPEFEKFLDSFIDMGIPGYDCIVRHHGEVVFRRFRGMSDIEKKLPMNGTERYNIYSCSKVATCCAALQLWEQGKFKLTDRLADYMPEFAEMKYWNGKEMVVAKTPITLWHLFTMTAGFTYDCNTPNLNQARQDTHGECQTRAVMPYLAKDPISFEPGTAFQYSLCHDVLAAFVEVISGMLFQDYVKKNIFEPVGMKRSSFLLPPEELDEVAGQYRYDSKEKKLIPIGKKIDFDKLGSKYSSGGAGCITTVEDYSLFLEALKNGKLLSPDTMKMWTTNQLSPEQLKTYWVANYGYGLGVRCNLDPADKIHTDYGWGGMAGAFLAIDPKRDYTLFHAQHVENSPNQLLRYRLPEMLAEFFDKNA